MTITSGKIVLEQLDEEVQQPINSIETIKTNVENLVNSVEENKSVINNLKSSIKFLKNIQVPTSAWNGSDSGGWSARITDENILSTSVVDVNFNLSSVKSALGVYGTTVSSNGYVTIYAAKQQTATLVCDIKIVNEVI